MKGRILSMGTETTAERDLLRSSVVCQFIRLTSSLMQAGVCNYTHRSSNEAVMREGLEVRDENIPHQEER